VPSARPAIGAIRRFADGTVVVARRKPLEAIAIVLLGVGGVVFPPVWLLGAGLVLLSSAWDLRGKWVGLAIPIVLVIAGTVLVVIVGGERHTLDSYALEVWLSVGRLSRVAAVFSSGYLVWRLHRGPRVPRQPPWNTPRRTG
jgi:hypothetical protein